MSPEDERALNLLFWSNISPYGEVKLDMTRRISLARDTAADVAGGGDDEPDNPH